MSCVVGSCLPVPLDEEFHSRVRARAGRPPMTAESLRERRRNRARRPDTASLLAVLGASEEVAFTDLEIPGPPGAPALPATILRPRRPAAGSAAALINFHGGGLVMGHRSQDTARLVPLVCELGVTVINVDYRLAPEHPYPAAAEDCYAALYWAAREAPGVPGLGIDPARIVVMGSSAGGGLAAATALMARDFGGPRIAGLLLLYPMLDDRMQTCSSRQVRLATWTSADNEFAWKSYLGPAAGGPGVSPHAAPARAACLSGLPPVYLEAAAADIFRDEDAAFASRAWKDRVRLRLTVYDGAPHGYDVLAPESRAARAAFRDRVGWLRWLLNIPARGGAGGRLLAARGHVRQGAEAEHPARR